jgi:hypothetical protein
LFSQIETVRYAKGSPTRGAGERSETERFNQQKNPGTFVPGLLAERWGFEPQNAFDTLHDFQSCALDQLSHLSTSSVFSVSGRGSQRSTIIPERMTFVKDFFEKI